jgi:hypothetical protein
MIDYDSIGANLRGMYYGYYLDEGDCSEDVVKLQPETILFWRRVAKIQKASGCSAKTFIEAQLKWFQDHGTDPFSLEAVETLVTEWALKRARFTVSGDYKRETSSIQAVPEEAADQARRMYDKLRSEHYPQDARIYSTKSDVWKRLVLAAEKSHEPLDKYLSAGFIYAMRERLKVPTPQLLSSEEGLRRSNEVNRTILDGPKI